MPASPLELHRRGLDESNSGRYAAARRLFIRALAGADSPDLAARIRLSLGYVEFELGSPDEGLQMCRTALSLQGVSRDVAGLVHSQLGLLQLRSGESKESLAEFAVAITMLGADPEPLATAHLNRGYLYLLQGDHAAAAEDLEQACRFATQADLPLVVAKAQHNLGYARLVAGDLVTALQLMDAAQPMWATESATYRALLAQDRAEVLRAAGMVDEAAAVLRQTVRVFGARRLRQYQADAELTLARMLLTSDPRGARLFARRASRRFTARSSPVWARRADAVALAAEVGTGRLRATFVAEADEIAQRLRADGLRYEAANLDLRASSALVRRGGLSDAAERLKGAYVGPSAPLSTRLLNREVRAQLSRARGKRSDAVRHLRKGLSELHGWQSSFGSLDLQSSLVGHGRGLALQGLSLAIEDGRPEVVFEWAERARALASRVPPVRPPQDPVAAADLAELRQLQTEIADAETRGAVTKALIAHAHQLRSRIRQRAWYDEGSGEVTEPVALDDAAHLLSSAAGALVSYLVVDDHIHALVVSGDVPAVVPLGPLADVSAQLGGMQADLDMAAARLPSAMQQAIRAVLDQRLHRLGHALVEPLRAMLGDRPLLIVPAGTLAGVPWSLLPGLRGRPLTVPRSATSWIVDRTRARRLATAGFVAGPHVERAGEEVKRAAEPWPGATALTGAAANSAAVHDLASRADVLHVAAHGRHSAENPLFSGLELADGPWFGYDIDRLGRIPSTVVLSACEVGRSSVRWGEETIGMTVAWLHAGATCVIASPASVNDDTACEMLAATHARLAVGDLPSHALASAGPFSGEAAPAPFVCFGSGW